MWRRRLLYNGAALFMLMAILSCGSSDKGGSTPTTEVPFNVTPYLGLWQTKNTTPDKFDSVKNSYVAIEKTDTLVSITYYNYAIAPKVTTCVHAGITWGDDGTYKGTLPLKSYMEEVFTLGTNTLGSTISYGEAGPLYKISSPPTLPSKCN